MFDISFYYTIITCTIAYLLLVVLGVRMHVYVKKNLKGANNTKNKVMLLNRQLNWMLFTQVLSTKIIQKLAWIELKEEEFQAALPFFIYASIVFMVVSVVFELNLDGVKEVLQYYNPLSEIFRYWQTTLNPIITITLIRPYRTIVLSAIRKGIGLSPTSGTGNNMQQ